MSDRRGNESLIHERSIGRCSRVFGLFAVHMTADHNDLADNALADQVPVKSDICGLPRRQYVEPRPMLGAMDFGRADEADQLFCSCDCSGLPLPRRPETACK